MANQSKTNIWIDGTQAGGTLKDLEKKVKMLNNEIKQLPINSDQYKSKMKELQNESKTLVTHKQQIKGVSESYGQAKNSIGGMMKQFAPVAGVVGAIGLAVSGVSSAVSSWYNNNKEMEKSLSSLKSLTGASAEDVQFYKEQAMEMGRTSTVSAMQTVEAFKLIGSARPDLLKNKEALAAVTKETITLAEAAEMDLAGAAEAMAGTMNQFNLGADQSARIINALAAGSKEGAAEITDISQSMEKFGTVANSNNVTVEESVALIELLSEKNIKGAEAGTQLRNVLLTVSTASALPKEALDAMEQYGVNLEKVQDTSIPLEERLRELSKVQGDQVALTKIFGKENIVAGQTVLKNVDHLAELTTAVTGTNVAYEQAAINTDNLDGDLKSLGSAWEGLTLSMEGGGSIFRPIVQAGTDFLNWTTDSITAIKEWDITKIETQMLKLANVIPVVNLLFGDYIEQQIRINEITSAVTDAYRKEADQVAVLTGSIMKNNTALAEGTLTEEEAIRAKEENDKIIAVLNEKYPELTKNIDLNKVSAEEMNLIQMALNETILEQAIATAKAAEQEKLIQGIIENTINLQRTRQEESKQSMLRQTWTKLMGDHSTDFAENIAKDQQNLKNLDKDFKGVEKAVKSLDLDFGVAFETNGKIAANAMKDLERLVKRYETTTDAAVKKSLEAQIKGLKQTIKTGNQNQQKELDGILGSFDSLKVKEADAAKSAEQAAARKVEANKKAADQYKKLKDALDALIVSTNKYKEDLDYNKRLDAFTDEQQKELFVLEHTLQEKYAKEIASAEELAKQKGDIGKKGQEQLNTLLAIKEEELAHEKLQINEKYAKQKQENDIKYNQESRDLFLKWEAGTEKAIIDLKVASAQAAAAQVADAEVSIQKAAAENLRKALIDQADYEKKVQLEVLKQQFINDDISAQERAARKEQIELEHRDKIEKITKESDEKISKMSIERSMQILDTISQVMDMITELQAANTQIRLNELETQKNAEIAALKEQYQKGVISKDQYESKSMEIERKADEERKKIEYEAAVRGKEAAKIQAVIGGALAIVQAFAQLGPVAGAITAAIVAVTTAAQIAVIDSQPLPQMYDGGFHNVIGAKDGKMYKAKNLGKHPGGMLPSSPSLVLASEKGPEYFVPNHLLQNQQVLNSVRVIEAIRTNQFADGGFTAPMAAASGAMSDERLVALMQANYNMLVALNGKIPLMRAVIDDGTVDDINSRTAELNALRN